MKQTELDFDAPPYQRHSDTSRKAAEVIDPSCSTLRAKVFTFIQEKGDRGATDDETQVALNMNPSTQRPRRIELVESGQVYDTGLRRATRSGRAAVVWAARRGMDR